MSGFIVLSIVFLCMGLAFTAIVRLEVPDKTILFVVWAISMAFILKDMVM